MKRLLRILSAVMIIAILACVCVACGKDTPTDETNTNGGTTENGGNGTSGGTTDEETTIPSVSGKTYKLEKCTWNLTEEEWRKAYDNRMYWEFSSKYFSESDVFNKEFKDLYNNAWTQETISLYQMSELQCIIEFKSDGSVCCGFFGREKSGTWTQTDDIVKIMIEQETQPYIKVTSKEIIMFTDALDGKVEDSSDDNDEYQGPTVFSEGKIYWHFVEVTTAEE